MFRKFSGIVLACFCAGWLGGVALTPESPRMFFPRPDTAAELRFKADAAGDVAWTLERFDGSPAGSGTLRAAEGRAVLPLTLPAGYFLLRAGEQSFGIFVAPEFTGGADAFFGVDAALSWLLTGRAETRRDLVELLPANGVFQVRERLWLGDLVPARDTAEVADTKRAYAELRRLYRENQVRVLDVSHDAPAWMKDVPASQYPDDLTAYGRAWEKIAAAFGGNWRGLEVWNEPDIGFGGKLPAEYYMPLVKSVAWSFRRAGVTVPVIGGVVTERCHENFWKTCLESGLADLVDGISIHHYSNFGSMGKMIASYRESLAGTRVPGLPILVTECGSHYPETGYYSNLSASRNAALQNVMKAIESKAFGAAGFYVFVYASYFEGGRSFSMWSRDFAPMPELAGYFTLTRKLANFHYAGDYAGQRVFRNGERAVVILTPGGALPPKAACAGIDGRSLDGAGVAAALKTDGMAYAETAFRELEERLERDTVAMRCLDAAGLPEKGPRPEFAPVILVPAGIDSGNRHFIEKSGVTVDSSGGKLVYKLWVVNPADRPETAELQVRLPWAVQSVPAPRRVTVPAGGRELVEFELELPGKPDVSRPYWLKFDGRCGDLAVTPLAVAVNFSAPGLKSGLAGARDIVEIPLLDATKWKSAYSGKGTLEISVTPQQTLKFDAKFETAGAHWFYPEFKIATPPAAGSVLLARLRAVPGNVHLYCQVRDRAGRVHLSKQLAPADGNWHKVTLTAADFSCFYPPADRGKALRDFGEISGLMFGESVLKGDSGEMELSDLLFYTK